jgi:hypothetical protein
MVLAVATLGDRAERPTGHAQTVVKIQGDHG